jgi:hypothetical protein
MSTTEETEQHHQALHDRVAALEHRLSGGAARMVPAWQRTTRGEHRWPCAVAVLAAIGLQLALPQDLAFHPKWLLPAIEFALFLVLVLVNPLRVNRRSKPLRALGLTLVVVASFATAWSAILLVTSLVNGTQQASAAALLINGVTIWATNVIVFGLWYWEADRGGPAARAAGTHQYPDFLFAEMTAPDMAPPDWEPNFVDYLYLSFTNATAFSPTDTLPMVAWAKLLMMFQSAVSLVTVALVVARAVNILA